MTQHIDIRKPQNAYAQLIEPIGTRGVIFHIFGECMLAAIEFDGQFCANTVEVDDIATNGMLATKLKAGKGANAENRPQFAFGIRGFGAEFSREFQQAAIIVARDFH